MEATLLEKWILKEKRVASLLKRKYLHFDRYIDFEINQKTLIKQLSNSSSVAKHAFYPFISTSVITPRYKAIKDEDGRKMRILEPKKRPIAYASHFDAFIYSWYSTVLSEFYQLKIKEWGIDDNVLAYIETGKSNIDYSFEIFSHIKSQSGCVAIALDLTSFFDNLDHLILKKMWCKVLDIEKLPPDHYNIYKSLTNYSTVSKEVLQETFAYRLPSDRYCTPEEFRDKLRKNGHIIPNTNKNPIVESKRFGVQCGIPQGSPISAVLSNVYMIDFDIRANEFAKVHNGIYKRYCDDIILICAIGDAELFLGEIKKLMLEHEVSLNDDKTEITYFIKNNNSLRGYSDARSSKFRNLQYLGFEFNGKDIYVRASSFSRYKRRIATEVREILKAANGKNSISNIAFKRKLLKRFSSKGKRNFISYASRAANKIMKSATVRKQYNRSIDGVLKVFNIKQARYVQKKRDKE